MNDQMESSSQKAKRVAIALGVSAVMIFLGYALSGAGYRVLREWHSVGPAFAAIGIFWLIVGPVMFGAGLWVLGSLGRHRIPFCIAGYSAALAGIVLIVGVLSYIVPCSGPS